MPMIRNLVLVTLAAVAPLLACKEKEEPLRTDLFADVCAQLFSCSCDDYPYADQDQCEQVYAVQYAGIAASAEAAGLTVDDACIREESGSFILEVMCKTPSEYFDVEDEPGESQCSFCAYAYGTVAAGQPCLDYGEFSDCAQGLACSEGACVDPCQPIGLGEDCQSSPGNCADGLHCSFDSGVCEQYPQEGEICTESPCADGLVCNWNGVDEFPTCQPPAGPGESCESAPCRDDLSCTFDPNTGEASCQVPAGLGESCNLAECAADLECTPDMNGNYFCRAEPKVGEPCVFGCEDGAYCDSDGFDGVCKPLPGDGQPCWQYECALGFECDENETCVAEQPLICQY